ncbi:MAG: bifunctional glycosyltransferase family 2/GtrA family protein [Lachnospiraceae bacterium]|nr:bifunctional glycosyltransferase family 2/GtrA family protein [Lachnospiraceae bacterium]MDE6698445.1 bifunctional glycosyltransferase family 2/GtrA family protein [Lachnospiraceae bacterium]
MNTTIIIPSLNPDSKLEKVVEGLVEAGYEDIVVVNDGSDTEHMEPFKRLGKLKQCTILTHEVNKGKGRALKTAFSYILENRKNIDGVVTVDGDNQHQVKDITACRDLMVKEENAIILGCREFSGENVPARSKFGNNFTRFIFRVACGVNISDTQTGLRAIPFQHLDKMLKIEGERFEYETNMLLSLKKLDIPYKEQRIETVYIEENQTSHFNPIVDSIKIYKIILKFMFSSVASSVIDIVMFSIFVWSIGNRLDNNTRVFIATVGARIISSIFNCIFNKKAVFKSNASFKKVLVRYYIVCVIQMSISYLLVSGLSWLLATSAELLLVIIKIVVDVVLFFISYRVQKAWVYKES